MKKTTLQPMADFLTSTSMAYLTGYGGSLMLKHGSGYDISIVDPDSVWLGGAFFGITGIIYTANSLFGDGKPISVNYNNVKSLASMAGIDSLLESLGMVTLNGTQTFLYSAEVGVIDKKKPIANLNRLGIDTVYFESHDNSGGKIQIPISVLRKFLRYAETNRASGRGLSYRYWSKCKSEWWNPIYYSAIMNLIIRSETFSRKWMKPNGIQLVMIRKNQWVELVNSAAITYRICSICQWPEVFGM